MALSVFIIATNEEKKIGPALDSVSWADEIVVLDGGSKDETVSVCKSKGANVFHRAFDSFSNQKNHALSLTQHEWVLSLDADERVDETLVQAIRKAILSQGSLAGYQFRRLNYFLGKPLSHGRQGKDEVLRLFVRTKGKFEGAVHEVLKIDGAVGRIEGTLIHEGTPSLDAYWTKFKLYTDLEAQKLKAEKRIPSLLKSVFYPPAMWFVDYVIYLGVLDGWNGFLYHGLSCLYGWNKNFKARRLRNFL